MSDITNVCIVGLGRAGNFHLDSIQKLGNAHLRYIVDPNLPDKKVIESKYQSLTVLDELTPALEDPNLHAVIVSSPTPYHFEHITNSLAAGKHVFAEKPLGHSLDQIRQSYTISRERNLALFLGFQRRYDHNFVVLKSKLGEISPLKIIKTSSRDNPAPSIDYLRMSGNIFKDMLIHDFDMLVNLLGPEIPMSILALGHAYDPQIKEIPDFDTVMVSMKYPTGLVCSIDTCRTSIIGYDQRIEIFGEKGMALAQNQLDHSVEINTGTGSTKAPVNHSFPQRYQLAYYHEIRAFIEGVNTSIHHNVTEKECIISYLMAKAAHKSAASNQLVNFTEYYESAMADYPESDEIH